MFEFFLQVQTYTGYKSSLSAFGQHYNLIGGYCTIIKGSICICDITGVCGSDSVDDTI